MESILIFFQVTHLPLVPPLVIFLSKTPLVKKYNLSSVKRAMSGAASLSKETEEAFRQRFNVPEMRQGEHQWGPGCGGGGGSTDHILSF